MSHLCHCLSHSLLPQSQSCNIKHMDVISTTNMSTQTRTNPWHIPTHCHLVLTFLTYMEHVLSTLYFLNFLCDGPPLSWQKKTQSLSKFLMSIRINLFVLSLKSIVSPIPILNQMKKYDALYFSKPSSKSQQEARKMAQLILLGCCLSPNPIFSCSNNPLIVYKAFDIPLASSPIKYFIRTFKQIQVQNDYDIVIIVQSHFPDSATWHLVSFKFKCGTDRKVGIFIWGLPLTLMRNKKFQIHGGYHKSLQGSLRKNTIRFVGICMESRA